MMNIPDLEVFENHGLRDIDVDLDGRISVGQSSAGWATLQPTAEHPLAIQPENDYADRRVKFYWCPSDDLDAARNFRRACQVWVIDSLARQNDIEHLSATHSQALAWWEDSGLWLITDEPKEDVQSLRRWWTEKLGSVDDNLDQASSNRGGSRNRDTTGQIYADLCDLFLSMTRHNQVS
jgi:hypothetical protein